MCRVLAERKLAVGLGGAAELLLFEKRVSGLHNSASAEMKRRQKDGRERERERKLSRSFD